MKKRKWIALIVATGIIVLLAGIYVHGESTNWGEADILGLHAKTNEERTAKGLKPLTLNADLIKSATDKCQDMKNRNYFEHNSPEGRRSWDFIGVHARYLQAGENLAQSTGSSDSTVNAWMNSPTHKDNILKESYTDVGYSVCGPYIVQHFITKQ